MQIIMSRTEYFKWKTGHVRLEENSDYGAIENDSMKSPKKTIPFKDYMKALKKHRVIITKLVVSMFLNYIVVPGIMFTSRVTQTQEQF